MSQYPQVNQPYQPMDGQNGTLPSYAEANSANSQPPGYQGYPQQPHPGMAAQPYGQPQQPQHPGMAAQPYGQPPKRQPGMAAQQPYGQPQQQPPMYQQAVPAQPYGQQPPQYQQQPAPGYQQQPPVQGGYQQQQPMQGNYPPVQGYQPPQMQQPQQPQQPYNISQQGPLHSMHNIQAPPSGEPLPKFSEAVWGSAYNKSIGGGWKQAQTASGQTYYINKSKRTTQWQNPGPQSDCLIM